MLAENSDKIVMHTGSTLVSKFSEVIDENKAKNQLVFPGQEYKIQRFTSPTVIYRTVRKFVGHTVSTGLKTTTVVLSTNLMFPVFAKI